GNAVLDALRPVPSKQRGGGWCGWLCWSGYSWGALCFSLWRLGGVFCGLWFVVGLLVLFLWWVCVWVGCCCVVGLFVVVCCVGFVVWWCCCGGVCFCLGGCVLSVWFGVGGFVLVGFLVFVVFWGVVFVLGYWVAGGLFVYLLVIWVVHRRHG
ncbi:hypothetical protein RA269_27835, partial [Pseudomonas syringae pv. tagetis]|uniref:hypothetical protein n=1 Tax=Pseudomonas syringae group genomosp. 7 TaxID=251699 RepID=UPI00376F94B2